MRRRTGPIAVAVAAIALLAGCAAPAAPIADSAVVVGLDVPYTGVGPAAPAATAADAAVGAATLAGFSYVDADGTRVADAGFGTVEQIGDDPLTVRYTVADAAEWSDGVGIDGVDLLLDWAARAHPFAGAAFGSAPDLALAGAQDVELSQDRKSLTITFAGEWSGWADAFRAPLPAHAVAARAFDSVTAEAAKDAVVDAVDAARHGDVDALATLAAAWATTFSTTNAPPPASGPYRLAAADDDLVELVANASYRGPRSPNYERLTLRTLDPAAAIQALSIGEVDVAQVAWSEGLRDALGRVGARARSLPSDAPSLLIGWYHRDVDGVEPADDEIGALWDPWAWAPYDVTSD